ncbi:MAG: septum site-determining protein MinC [Methyloprofundus sp.]|nr:septum site-determining protein MinC [Methyloprofundus sp.]
MSSDPQKTSANFPAFEFKSGVITVPVLNVLSTDINVISHQLREKINQAPEFFKNSSLLIDLQALDDQELNLAALVDTIRNAEMVPIGIRGATAEQKHAAKDLMLPVMSAQRSTPAAPVEPAAKTITAPVVNDESASDKATTSIVGNTVIRQPVRSGQRIYVKGDLTIIAQVSAGAEIMAEGSIHVYGTLRGRALAGVQGDEGAGIFCSDLQAELVSIAGNYRISEDIDDAVRHAPVHIYLDKQALLINKI